MIYVLCFSIEVYTYIYTDPEHIIMGNITTIMIVQNPKKNLLKIEVGDFNNRIILYKPSRNVVYKRL